MSSAWSMPLRALATQTAVITMMGLGLAAPSAAAQGDALPDQANDMATSATTEASENQATQADQQPAPSGQAAPSEQAAEAGGTAPANRSENRSDGSSMRTEKSGEATPASGAKPSGTGLDDDRRTQTGDQPVSNADLNSSGANGGCSDAATAPEEYFCGTDRTGKASGNGQGGGEAVGKPYQAHKGKADNKNPPGQDQNDSNNGYECDGNQGIAKGNPAHTSCVTTTTTGGGNGGGGNGGGNGGGGGGVIPPVVGGVDTGVPPAVAPPEVKGVETLVPPAGVELHRPPAQAPGAVVPGAAVLPATGAAPAMTALSALALGMLVLGSAVLLYRRFTA